MRKLILLMFMSIFLISIVSALEFDNVLRSEKNVNGYPELKIVNGFGLGSDVVKMNIQENTAQCLIDCYTIINITLYSAGTLPANFEAFKHNGQPTSKLFNYHYQVNKSNDVIIPHYTEVCGNEMTVNGTMNVCRQVNDYNTTQKVISYEWKRYKGEVMNAGNYLFRIEAKKNPTEQIDWAFAYNGITTEQIKDYWAWWNADWNRKKNITLVNVNGSITNFTKYLEIDYDSDMQSDWDDLRFTDSSETTELPYSFDFINSTKVGVWIRIPSLSLGTNIIYMYYGNTGATAGNSSANTFAGIKHFMHLRDSTNLGTTDTFSNSGTPLYMNTTTMKSAYYVSNAVQNGLIASGNTNFTNDYTFNFVISPNASSPQYLIETITAADAVTVSIGSTHCGAGTNLCIYSGAWVNCGAIQIGNYSTVTFKQNSTSGYCYINGVRRNTYTKLSSTGRVTLFYRDNDANKGFLGNATNYELHTSALSDNYIAEMYGNINSSSYSLGTETILNGVTTNLISPVNQYNSTLNNINLSANATSFGGGNITNITFYLWNGTTNTYTFDSINNNFTSQTWNFIGLARGANIWNAYSCMISSADSSVICSWGTNRTINHEYLFENSRSYNITSFETKRETFTINITAINSTPTGIMYYNQTPYVSSVSGGNGQYVLSNTFDIPIGLGLKNITWNITINGTTITTYVGNITVNNAIFGLCNGTLTNKYLNITFKNETLNQERVNATISSSWNYYMGSGTVNRTYSLTNSTPNYDYTFCFYPQNESVNVMGNVQYGNSESATRSYSNELLSLTNTTTNVTLWLLPYTAGWQQVSFQVRSLGGSVIPSALVEIQRSGYGVIEQRLTDASGVASFYLNPSVTYTVTVTKSGYTTFSEDITPSQTQYTITLGGSSSSNNNTAYDFSRGVTISSIIPSGIELVNQTSYTFGYTISSTYWTLSSYGFNITDQDGNLVGSASDSQLTGSSISTIINTQLNDTFTMNYYYYISGNLTSGTLRVWIISNSGDNSYSIFNFVERFKSYTNNTVDSDGLFGLTFNSEAGNFSLAIIIFLIIFVTTGIFSYRYGISGTTGIVFIIFTMVLMFDVGFGWFPRIMGVPHFLTIFMALILVGSFMKEEMF